METTRTRVTTCQPAAWLNVEGEIQPKTAASFEQFDADFQAAQEMGIAARRKRLGLENDAGESSRDGNTTSSMTEPNSGAATNGTDASTSDENILSASISPPPAPRTAKALLVHYEPVPKLSPQTALRELEERGAAPCGYHIVMK